MSGLGHTHEQRKLMAATRARPSFGAVSEPLPRGHPPSRLGPGVRRATAQPLRRCCDNVCPMCESLTVPHPARRLPRTAPGKRWSAPLRLLTPAARDTLRCSRGPLPACSARRTCRSDADPSGNRDGVAPDNMDDSLSFRHVLCVCRAMDAQPKWRTHARRGVSIYTGTAEVEHARTAWRIYLHGYSIRQEPCGSGFHLSDWHRWWLTSQKQELHLNVRGYVFNLT